MATVTKKTVLITGCSTGGIGWALAKNFHQHGYHVFATVRDSAKAGDLAELSDVDILELDVTLPETIAKCREMVVERAGGKLDVLVNTAGVEFLTPLLDTDIAEAKKLYDVNVWGLLAMVQAFAPSLIKAKGVIVNQSSIDAALSMVWAGIFASSKIAAMRISETLRVELEPLGVRVVTVMSGSVNTPMFDKPGGALKLPATSYYHGVEATALQERMDHRKTATKVDVQASELVKSILAGSRGIVWRGALATLVRFMTWALPTSLVDRLVNAERGVKKVKRL